MKKIFCLLLIIFLTSCTKPKTTINSMTISEASLTKEEQKIMELFNRQVDDLLYDFKVDETVNNMKLSIYELNNGEWSLLSSNEYETVNKEGRLLLEFEEICEEVRITYQDNENTYSTIHQYDYENKIITGGSTQITSQKIELNKEIILATQVRSENKDINLYDVNMQEAAQLYTKDGYEHVYIITIVFTN